MDSLLKLRIYDCHAGPLLTLWTKGWHRGVIVDTLKSFCGGNVDTADYRWHCRFMVVTVDSFLTLRHHFAHCWVFVETVKYFLILWSQCWYSGFIIDTIMGKLTLWAIVDTSDICIVDTRRSHFWYCRVNCWHHRFTVQTVVSMLTLAANDDTAVTSLHYGFIVDNTDSGWIRESHFWHHRFIVDNAESFFDTALSL